MSRWILIALIILNIYVFLNISNTSRLDMVHAVGQIPFKVGEVIQDSAMKIEETK